MYNEKLAERIRKHLGDKKTIGEKKMFGGLCFLNSGNMICGIVGDKLMARVGPENYQNSLLMKHVSQMDFNGKSMKGMIYINPDGIKTGKGLAKWLNLCLDFTEKLPKKNIPNPKRLKEQANINLAITFAEIKLLLQPYAKSLTIRKDSKNHYELWSVKDITIAGRRKKEVYFGGITLYATYVGFYFMPVYSDPGLKDTIADEILGLLKGKSCFHIKVVTPDLKKQIRETLKQGYNLYQKKGWV